MENVILMSVILPNVMAPSSIKYFLSHQHIVKNYNSDEQWQYATLIMQSKYTECHSAECHYEKCQGTF